MEGIYVKTRKGINRIKPTTTNTMKSWIRRPEKKTLESIYKFNLHSPFSFNRFGTEKSFILYRDSHRKRFYLL